MAGPGSRLFHNRRSSCHTSRSSSSLGVCKAEGRGFRDPIEAVGGLSPSLLASGVTRPVCSDLVPGPLGGISEGQLGPTSLLGITWAPMANGLGHLLCSQSPCMQSPRTVAPSC